LLTCDVSWTGDHLGMPEDIERRHIKKAIDIHERVPGQRPPGSFIGRRGDNTARRKAKVDQRPNTTVL